MQCNFQVGQKVVCVGDNWHWQMKLYEQRGARAPVKGVIYTVRALDCSDPAGRIGIFVSEIINPVVATTVGARELSFTIENFRPLVTRKTDISVFTALLTPSKQTEPA